MSNQDNQLPLDSEQTKPKEVQTPKTQELSVEDKIKYLESKHQTTVYAIIIEDKKCFIKKPNRNTYSSVLRYLMPATGEPDYLTAGQRIIQGGWIDDGSDKEILSDDDYLVSACMQALRVVKLKEGELKKR